MTKFNNKIKLNLAKVSQDWRSFIKEQYSTSLNLNNSIKKKIEIIIKNTPLKDLSSYCFELNFYLVDNNEILTINSRFRNKNSATNVLAFSLLNISEIKNIGLKNLVQKFGKYLFLGEVFFSYQNIAQEAIDAGKSLDDHFIHLIVHGILHLLGYDHIEDCDALIMENLEIKILASFGIKNPYIV